MRFKKLTVFIFLNILALFFVLRSINHLDNIKKKLNDDLVNRTKMQKEIEHTATFQDIIKIYEMRTERLQKSLNFTKSVDALIFITDILNTINIKPVEISQKEDKDEGIIRLVLRDNYKNLYRVLEKISDSEKLLKFKQINMEKETDILKMRIEIRVNLHNEN